MTKNRELTKTIEGALELLKSENTEDKILATVILGKLGKENIKHLFELTDIFIGATFKTGHTDVYPVRIIYINDCKFWLGGTRLNLLHDEYSLEDDKSNIPDYEYLNFNE